MQLAVVTYTHNDAALLDGLLENLLRSSVCPQQIFIFDDCSKEPYVLSSEIEKAFQQAAKGKAPTFSLLRFEAQRGPAQAKKYALDFVFNSSVGLGAEVVLSLDCDIRLHPLWLQSALPLLQNSDVGLVGADIAHGLAGDALSRYLRAFEQPQRELLEVPFLPAGIWLMRRDTWQATGGLGGHEQFTHEDLFFCRRLQEFNLRLLALNTLPITQVRRLDRRAHVRRELSYLGFALLGACRSQGAQQALLPVKERSQQRLNASLAKNEPAFFYLELLWLTALLYWLAQREALGEKAPLALNQLTGVLHEIFGGYVETLSLLGGDLQALGIKEGACLQTLASADKLNNLNIAPTEGAAAKLAREMLSFWLLNIDSCGLLETKGVPAVLKDDAEFEFATHYLEPENQH